MANSVVRLNIDSHEFDANIKRAGEALNKFFDQARKGDRTFEVLDDDAMEVIKTFGRMETSSKSARGQLSELTKGFTDLSLVYKRMTDEEKASKPGKIVSEQLNILKDRIAETKGHLSEINGEINGGGGLTGALDQLAGKFGLNIQQLAGWGAAIGAAKVALDVAKDAFFASEATVDEWGRVMDSSKSLYEGFLTALNTGDISGYLSRINEIVSAARTAYNEIDRLGTLQTIQAPQKSAQQTENDRMRQMIQTGHYIAPLDSRKPAPGMKDGQLLTPEQIRRLEQQLQNGMKTVVGLIGNEVKQTGKAIDAVYERQAKELGMSLSEFRKGTSSMAEFDKRMEEARAYQEFEAKRRQAQALASSGHNLTPEQSAILNAANPNQRGAKWATFRVDGDRYNELVQLILQRDQQAAQAYGMQSQAYRAINRAEGITTRSLLGGGSGGGKTGGGSVAPLNIKLPKKSYVQDFSSDSMLANNWMESLASVNSGMFAELKAKQVANINRFAEVNDIPLAFQLDESATQQQIKDALDNINMFMGENPIQLNFATGDIESAGDIAKDGKKAEDTWKNAASAVQSVGSAFSQIEDPGVKAMGTVMQAIASIALGYAQATVQASSMGPWAWIAFAASGLATMLATISSIHSATGYAEGGIIKGNSYSGDNIGGLVDGSQYVGLNAGELVLNASQQGTLAEALISGSNQGGGGSGTPYVTGEKIVLGINNYGKKQGWGELVFSRR